MIKITKKIFLTLFFSTFLVFVSVDDTAEASATMDVIELYDPENIITGNWIHRYNGSYDEIYFKFTGRKIVKMRVTSYNSDFSQQGTSKTRYASEAGFTHYTATGFTCNTSYVFEGFDYMDNLLIKIKGTVTGLEKPKCNSDGDGEGESSDSECSTLICECIADLQKPLNDIKESIDGVKGSVEGVKNELSILNNTTTEIKNVLEDFSNEFKTDIGYKIPDFPSTDGLLEQNKPNQNTKPFEDNNVYFKDEGDAPDADPGKLPKAPDIKDWDGFKPEQPMPPEKELDSDKVLKPDKELDLDKFEQSPELKPDKFEQSPELNLDQFEQSPEFNLDSFDQAPELNQNHWYEQTNQFKE